MRLNVFVLVAFLVTLCAPRVHAQPSPNVTSVVFAAGATKPSDLAGSGTPNGVITAVRGSTYRDWTNGKFYVNTTGTNVWAEAITSGLVGSGTVTSVGLVAPSTFIVSGSPVTTTGSLTFGWNNASVNTVFTGPSSGASATPTFRALVEADLPLITTTKLTDATILFADWASNGCTTNQIPKYNGTAWACAADASAAGAPDTPSYLTLLNDATLTAERVLTAGTNITFNDTGANGTLTINSAAGGTTYLRKTADETVNNSATLQNDDHLTWAVGANEVYVFEVFLLLSGPSATPDWKMGFSVPAGTTMTWAPHSASGSTTQYWNAVATTTSAPTLLSATDTLAWGSAASTTTSGVFVQGMVVTSATTGSITVQWAQNTATVANSTVLTNSLIRYRKIN